MSAALKYRAALLPEAQGPPRQNRRWRMRSSGRWLPRRDRHPTTPTPRCGSAPCVSPSAAVGPRASLPATSTATSSSSAEGTTRLTRPASRAATALNVFPDSSTSRVRCRPIDLAASASEPQIGDGADLAECGNEPRLLDAIRISPAIASAKPAPAAAPLIATHRRGSGVSTNSSISCWLIEHAFASSPTGSDYRSPECHRRRRMRSPHPSQSTP